MAHPYTTKARVQARAIAHRVNELLDRDDDGSDDSGVSDDAIGRACNTIDEELGQRYSVPFASSSGVATAGIIADLANELTLANLLDPIDYVRAEAIREKALARLAKIRSGETQIGVTPISTQRRRPVRYESAGTYAAGRIDDDYTDDGVDKMKGV